MRPETGRRPDSSDSVIIGAGRYGLSIAAHFLAKGVEHRIFDPLLRFARGAKFTPIGLSNHLTRGSQLTKRHTAARESANSALQ